MDGWMDEGGGERARARDAVDAWNKGRKTTLVVAWTGGGARHTGRYWG